MTTPTTLAGCGCSAATLRTVCFAVLVAGLLLLAPLLIGAFVLMSTLTAGAVATSGVLPAPAVLPVPPVPASPLPVPDGTLALLAGALLFILVLVLLGLAVVWWLWRLRAALRLLGAAAPGLHAAAQALSLMAEALTSARAPVGALSSALSTAGEKVDVKLPTVEAKKQFVDLLQMDVVVGLKHADITPFSEVHQQLDDASLALAGRPDGSSLTDRLNEAAGQCRTAAAALDAIATQLQGGPSA